MLDEPEILDGHRAWPETQTVFRGPHNPASRRFDVEACWYDTSVDENDGAFCMIQSGSDLEELVGEVLEVDVDGQLIYVYCVGGAPLATEFGLCRRAFMAVSVLSELTVFGSLRAVSP